MKKLLSLVLMLSIAFVANVAVAQVSNNDTFSTVNVTVGPAISIACDPSVAMGTITGTGTASNTGTCTIITNNASGYDLDWTASAATMTNDGSTFAAYTPASPNTPETWSVAATAAEWGGRLSSTSTYPDTGTWGTDSSDETYLDVDTSAYTIVSPNRETSVGGDAQVLEFKSEVGSNVLQETGSYTVNVTMTATTL